MLCNPRPSWCLVEGSQITDHATLCALHNCGSIQQSVVDFQLLLWGTTSPQQLQAVCCKSAALREPRSCSTVLRTHTMPCVGFILRPQKVCSASLTCPSDSDCWNRLAACLCAVCKRREGHLTNSHTGWMCCINRVALTYQLIRPTLTYKLPMHMYRIF